MVIFFYSMVPFVLNSLFTTQNVSKNFHMLQTFTINLNIRIISTSLEFSKKRDSHVLQNLLYSAVEGISYYLQLFFTYECAYV